MFYALVLLIAALGAHVWGTKELLDYKIQQLRYLGAEGTKVWSPNKRGDKRHIFFSFFASVESYALFGGTKWTRLGTKTDFKD